MRRVVVLAAATSLFVSGSARAWSWPADGTVLRPFAVTGDPYAAGQHRGIDIAGEAGARVLAPAAGVVTFAGSVGANGKTVTIETADGYAVTLVHLGSISVAKGDAVAERDLVGAIGPSGDPEVDQPYVHLGIRVSGDPEGYVDPLSVLPPRAMAPPTPSPDPEPAPAPPAPPEPAPQPHPEPAPPPEPAPAPAPAPAPEPPTIQPEAPAQQGTRAAAPEQAVPAPDDRAVGEPADPAVVSARGLGTGTPDRPSPGRPMLQSGEPRPRAQRVGAGAPGSPTGLPRDSLRGVPDAFSGDAQASTAGGSLASAGGSSTPLHALGAPFREEARAASSPIRGAAATHAAARSHGGWVTVASHEPPLLAALAGGALALALLAAVGARRSARRVAGRVRPIISGRCAST